MSSVRILTATVLCAAATLAAARPEDDFDADALAARLQALCAQHEMLHAASLGESLGGNALHAVEVRAGDAPLGARQGLLVVAGLDGRRTNDARLLCDVLAELAGRADLVERLGGRALVFVPRANPDGAEASLGRLGPRLATAGNGRPDDADRDGRSDEDGPSDLDGDGRILWMRAEDGAGTWVADAHDPRALRKARRERGERGRYVLRLEGDDDDGDGAWHEDGHDGVRVDRNFPHGWAEHAAEAGAYPLSEPESAALARFVLEHEGLAGVFVLGDEDTLVSAPKKAKESSDARMDAPLDGIHADDVTVLSELGRRLEVAGAKAQAADGVDPQDGSFVSWAYHHAGRWPLALTSWLPPKEMPKPAKGKDGAKTAEDAHGDDEAEGPGVADDASAADASAADASAADASALADAAASPDGEPSSDADSPVPAAVLAWMDAEGGGAGFVPWTEFEHDELGTVEIGGLPPGLLVDGPYEAIAPLAAPLADFLLECLAALPSLVFEDVAMTRHGGGVYTVEAALVNEGVLPTAPRLAADTRLARPVRVRLVLPPGVERAAGPVQQLVPFLPGGGGRSELRWVLAGARSGTRVTLIADADSVADVSLEIILP